jgi:capsular polysaccharide biosynthesis protein
MTEPPLDLRASAAVLRRGWVAILVIAIIGLCAGIGYGLVGRSQSSAVALVLVPPQFSNGSSDPTNEMATQTLIAMSSQILTPASESLNPPVPFTKLKVTATSPANTNILRIQVHAPSYKQAVQMANAVATGYIQYVGRYGVISGKPILLQPASTAMPAATTSRLNKSGPIGLAAGLLVGVIVVYVRAKGDCRLRRRDEIADALGLPVLAAIEAGRYKSVTEWTRFLENYEPSPTSLWNLRRVLNYMLRDHYQAEVTIRIVSYADDESALAAGPQLAMAAAELGISARIEPGMQEALAPLRAACAQLKRSGYIERSSPPDVHDDDPWRRMWDTRNQASIGSEFTISILTLERSIPEWSPFAGRSILAISAGTAVADELARLALAAAEGGGEIEGIILVNPEPGDGGAGVVPDRQGDHHTAHIVNDYPGDAAPVVGQPT